MKKFMSTKQTATPQPAPRMAPAESVEASPHPASTEPTATFATFEALLHAASPPAHPALANAGRERTVGACQRKIRPKPRKPPTPFAPLTFDFSLSDGDGSPEKRPPTGTPEKRPPTGSPARSFSLSPASSVSTPSLAAPSSPSTTTASTGVIKMCGYLKKKRNKMGGWRKLFFILQNQLLLSYSSRDDYEKKLAPFKDIINLVPGTMIIPTTGPRFTIETNSKVMYTFRCDDQGSCSEWIMALLDSLKAVNGGLSNERTFSPQNIFQRSTLPLASIALPPRGKFFDRPTAIVQRTHSNHGPAPIEAPPKPPRAFIANDGQRQVAPDARGGPVVEISEDALNNNVAPTKSAAEVGGNGATGSHSSKSSGKRSSSMERKIMVFESHAVLHPARENVPSKNSVKDIGGGSSSERRQDGEGQTSPSDRCQMERGPQQADGGGEQDAERWKWWLRDRQPGKQRPEEGEALPVAKGADAVDGVDGSKVEQHAPVLEQAREEPSEEEKRGQAGDGTQQTIFRLHPDAWRTTRQSVDVCRINSMFGERTSTSELVTVGVQRSGSEHPTASDRRLVEVEKAREVAGIGENPERGPAGRKPIASSCSALPAATETEPESLPVEPLEKASQKDEANRRASEVPPDPFAVYAEIRDFRKPAGGEERREAASEPIYAVVDICAKRTRRAARQQQGQGEEQERSEPPRRSPFASVSLPQIPSETDAGRERAAGAKRCYSNNNDYEDVNDFLDRLEEDDGCGGRGEPAEHDCTLLCGDEHIYEPIQVPHVSSDTSGSSSSLPASSSSGAPTTTTTAGGGNSLWKQLKRMHLQSSRHRLALRKVFAGSKPAADAGNTSESDADPAGRAPSALEGLGRRLDSHRRSIKKRIKSLYERGAHGSSGDDEGQQRTDAPRAEVAAAPFNRAHSTRKSRKSLSLDSFLATGSGGGGGGGVGGDRKQVGPTAAPRLLIEAHTK